jgi:hypothetical protein
MAGARIGQSLERCEDFALLTGRGRYADDLPVAAGTLHAAILRSPHAHARDPGDRYGPGIGDAGGGLRRDPRGRPALGPSFYRGRQVADRALVPRDQSRALRRRAVAVVIGTAIGPRMHSKLSASPTVRCLRLSIRRRNTMSSATGTSATATRKPPLPRRRIGSRVPRTTRATAARRSSASSSRRGAEARRRGQWWWAEASIWTERMVSALGDGFRGGKW